MGIILRRGLTLFGHVGKHKTLEMEICSVPTYDQWWKYPTLFRLELSGRMEGDHTPMAIVELTVFGITLVGITLYDTRHENDR